jgi:hypothetical protein
MQPPTDSWTAAGPGRARRSGAHPALGLAAVVAFVAALLAGTACRSGDVAGGYAAFAAPAARFQPVDGGNWAGQVVLGDTFESVASSWTVPRASCNSRRDVVGAWVGLGGVGVNSVQQTGIEINCRAGRPAYRAWYEMFPAPPIYYDGPVAAGDRINATVTRSGTRYTLTLKNATQGWTGSTVQRHGTAPTSAEVIVESPTGRFPDFGRFSFSGSKVDGETLGELDPVAVDASNDPVRSAHTRPVRGGSFSITYVDSRE